MAGAFFYGQFARYGLASTAYDGKGWSIDPKVEEHRTDNTGGQGFSDRIGGINDCTFVIETDWDADANPMDDPPGLRAGNVLTNLRLHFDEEAASPYWSFPKAIILGTPVNCMIDAVCHITANGANKGIYYRPTGDFTPTETDDNVEPEEP
jgi:hypothetical protein